MAFLHNFAIGFSVFAIMSYMLHLMWSYKQEIQNKNIKLIQFYLDMKFMWKGLTDNLNITNTAEFCHKFMIDIKEYFSLDDIIIIDSLKMARNEKNTLLRRAVIDYIKGSAPRIEKLLQDNTLLSLKYVFEEKNYTLYVTSITPDVVNDGLVIAVESDPSLLSQNELVSLENCINLLKTRLMYN